ncbi:uncharacterized protein LOC129535107 isoform X2 [Moschus berezovskii]|uniref:uncharacterized protein LOC129535107 isoform X2 n=1 Tax=Moschus berezovskii TaxID=68408 RepID=UPI0024451469|nr:uncharacterized protein LOC129535107 isoform X2 [Moschus berezovskii]
MHWRITDAGLGETSQTLSVGTECPLLQRTDAGRSHKLVGDCCPTFSFASRRQEVPSPKQVLVTQMAGGPRTRKETTQFCKLTWDDCQQLLQILFTTEERERIQAETRKKVPGANGEATNNIDEINASFPLSRPEWDFNMAQDDLLVADQDYQTCLAGTKDLLRTIGELGYRASAKKAQICKPEVTYLGDVWKRLKALYESGTPLEPHRYRLGDWVYMRHHCQETLEPRWKGPYVVVLTTPTALKVNGIASLVHYTHVRPADPFALREVFLPQWKPSQTKTTH